LFDAVVEELGTAREHQVSATA